jgi:hypothetical protein
MKTAKHFFIRRRSSSYGEIPRFNSFKAVECFILTVLISLSTLKVEGMIQPQAPKQTELPIQASMQEQPINPLEPLHDICNEGINMPLLQEAFADAFGLICAMVIQQNNPSESNVWLESKKTWKEIDDLDMKLKEHITYAAALATQTFPAQSLFICHPGQQDVGLAIYYSRLFQALHNEVTQLYKKINMLIDVLSEVITTGQKPEYLNDAQQLQAKITSQVWRKDLWNGLANASGSCLIL